METEILPKGKRGRTEQIADWCRAKPGCTIRDACSKFQVSPSTVYSACYQHEVTLTRLNAWTEPEVRVDKIAAKTLTIIARLQNTTQSYQRIADDFGIKWQAVQDVAKRAVQAGIRLPSRGQKRKKQEMTHE